MPLLQRGISLKVAVPNSDRNTFINELLGNRNDDILTETLWARVRILYEIEHHATRIFPEATNLDVVFTSGVPADTWGAWTEIQDSDVVPTTFSSKITSDTHFSAIMPEDVDIIDQKWMLEIAYGSERIVIARLRVISGAQNKFPAVSQQRIRADHIPAGSKIYYRMMDETGGGEMCVSIRYYFH